MPGGEAVTVKSIDVDGHVSHTHTHTNTHWPSLFHAHHACAHTLFAESACQDVGAGAVGWSCVCVCVCRTQSTSLARAGDSVEVQLSGSASFDPSHLPSGAVLCNPDYPVPMVTKVRSTYTHTHTHAHIHTSIVLYSLACTCGREKEKGREEGRGGAKERACVCVCVCVVSAVRGACADARHPHATAPRSVRHCTRARGEGGGCGHCTGVTAQREDRGGGQV